MGRQSPPASLSRLRAGRIVWCDRSVSQSWYGCRPCNTVDSERSPTLAPHEESTRSRTDLLKRWFEFATRSIRGALMIENLHGPRDGDRHDREPREPSLAGISLDRPDWKERWASLCRLGCSSDVIESKIFRLRELQEALRRYHVTDSTTAAVPQHNPDDVERLHGEILKLDESLSTFMNFMKEVRRMNFSPSRVGLEFSDQLFSYYSSERRLADFAAFKEEAPLPPGYDHLHSNLFCKEIGRYVEEIKTLLEDRVGKAHSIPRAEDIELFIGMIIDPVVYLPSSEWIEVVQVCRALTDAGILTPSRFLDFVNSLVARDHATDTTIEVVCGSLASLRGGFAPEADESLFRLGVSIARKRNWSDLFERPSISTHAIIEFGYFSELLHRSADFNVESRENRRVIMSRVLHHHAVLFPGATEDRWYSEGTARMQAAMIKIMEHDPADFAIESLHVAHRVLWKTWEDLGLLWRGATLGVGFGDPSVQHTFLRYILQDRYAVGALKGILSEGATALGANSQLVGGLRQILRDRRCGTADGISHDKALRALELLDHTGSLGLAAAPEVLSLLGISAYEIPGFGRLISAPWPCSMDSASGVRRRARALVARWEAKYGTLGPTIQSKLARYDARMSS